MPFSRRSPACTKPFLTVARIEDSISWPSLPEDLDLEISTEAEEEMREDLWKKYCKKGDLSLLYPEGIPEDVPVWKLVQLSERSRIKLVDSLRTDEREEVEYYDAYVEILAECLVDLTQGWPDEWPDKKWASRKGSRPACLSRETIRLLPYSYVISIGNFMIEEARLRDYEKKA